MLLHVATHNSKKLVELKRVLKEAGVEGVELVSSEDLLGYPEPEEDGRTFADNALIKARAGAKETHLVTLADDSGLSVDELGGMPGVLSARWCGKHGDDEANNELLLNQMAHVPLGRRTARFVSVCAVVTPDGDEYLEKGTWEGRLVKTPVGDNGFGYDPLFIPAEEDARVEGTDERPRTSAELEPAEKDSLSHRGKALAALVPVLAELATKYSEDGSSVKLAADGTAVEEEEDESPIAVVDPDEDSADDHDEEATSGAHSHAPADNPVDNPDAVIPAEDAK